MQSQGSLTRAGACRQRHSARVNLGSVSRVPERRHADGPVPTGGSRVNKPNDSRVDAPAATHPSSPGAGQSMAATRGSGHASTVWLQPLMSALLTQFWMECELLHVCSLLGAAALTHTRSADERPLCCQPRPPEPVEPRDASSPQPGAVRLLSGRHGPRVRPLPHPSTADSRPINTSQLELAHSTVARSSRAQQDCC